MSTAPSLTPETNHRGPCQSNPFSWVPSPRTGVLDWAEAVPVLAMPTPYLISGGSLLLLGPIPMGSVPATPPTTSAQSRWRVAHTADRHGHLRAWALWLLYKQGGNQGGQKPRGMMGAGEKKQEKSCAADPDGSRWIPGASPKPCHPKRKGMNHTT